MVNSQKWEKVPLSQEIDLVIILEIELQINMRLELVGNLSINTDKIQLITNLFLLSLG